MNTLLVILLIVAAPDIASGGETPKLPNADEIVQRVNARDEGVSVVQSIEMEMTDKHGKKRSRETRRFRKYYENEKRSVVFYRSPSNVKGTAFLTIDYNDPNKEDDQWLYLPSLRKVRRIAAENRRDYFLGTDLTYEDLRRETRINDSDYAWKTLGAETIEDCPCYVIEGTPVSETLAIELGCGKVLVWVDKGTWFVRRSEFRDVNGNISRTIDMEDLRRVQGIWTAHKITAINHKAGSLTRLTFVNVDYEPSISDDVFTEQGLKRGCEN